MAEKRGHTAKKLHDFNTAGALEVCIKGNWYRVTCNEFRSFDGNRRITEPSHPVGQGADMSKIVMKTYDYNGPVYVLQTNQEVVRMDTETIVTNPYTPIKQTSLENSSRI